MATASVPQSSPCNTHLLLEGRPGFIYPFEERLLSYLREQGLTCLPIFGYGSLINAESAANTLNCCTVSNAKPAMAFGLRRLYNYVPKQSTQYDLTDQESIGMLNVVETGSMADRVNGVVFWVSYDEIPALCKREESYDLIPVVVTLWGEECPFVAWAFSAVAPRMGRVQTSKTIRPLWPYHRLVKKGAECYGQEYLDFYLDHTFLADGETSLRRWESRETPP